MDIKKDTSILKELAERKEKEWRDIQEQRIEALESLLKVKCQELCDEKSKLNQLKVDFKYNLKLLNERDSEIENFEQTLLTTRKQLSEKNSEISELKIQLDSIRQANETEKTSIEDCKKYYLNRLTQKQNEVDKYKAAKDSEINKERNEIEKYKRNLQRQLQDLQFELDKQRSELKTEFDEVLRKREHEWRLQTDDFNDQLNAKELQVKLISTELDQCRETNESLKLKHNEMDATIKSLERKLKENEWELKDAVALKDSRIKELESKLNKNQSNIKNINEDLSRKCDDLDRALRDKQAQLENLKAVNQDAENQKKYLEKQIDELKVQIKQLNAQAHERERERDNQVADLHEEMAKLKLIMDKEMEAKAKKTVSSDLTIEQLKDECENLRGELKSKIEVIEHLKEQLNEYLAKQNELEHEKLQLNLDWTRKYAALEKVKADDADQFTNDIIEQRDKAINEKKSLEDKLNHKENVIKALQTADPTLNTIQLDSTEFQLKEENEKLKSIVKQMREEMENLALDPKIMSKESLRSPSSTNSKQEFESHLERQLLECKQKNRQLQAQIDEFVLKQKLPDKLTDSTFINNHVKSLNDSIMNLKKEKVDLIALSKKQQTKLLAIEKNWNETSDEVRVKQAQIETLQYELNSQTRRATSEQGSMKQQIANLELELSATRREADEYHKATIEKNSEVAALENKLSEYKLKLSNAGTNVNYGAQELFIQQLQDEITRLSKLNEQLIVKTRQQHHQLLRMGQKRGSRATSESESDSDDQDDDMDEETNSEIKSKLKKALVCINELTEEKFHLIDMNNQLKGELNRIKFEKEKMSIMRMNREAAAAESESKTPTKLPASSSSPSRSPNRLKQLEKNQYDLTKQKLANDRLKLNAKYNTASTSDDETPLTASNSSVKSDHLKEIWKILDEEDHGDTARQNSSLTSAIQINSIKPIKPPMPVSAMKTPTTNPIHRSASTNSATVAAVTARLTSRSPKPRIRNYNIKN